MTHYSHSRPKARKPHVCVMCGRTITPGENYLRTAGMDGSSAWTWLECAHCEVFVSYAYSASWPDDGYGPDLLSEFAPACVAQARVLAQYRRRWRRLNGDLYPLPVALHREDKYGFRHVVDIAPGAAA